MGLIRPAHQLSWNMKLGEGGYTCFELLDGHGRRWGWAVNAAASGWTAHVGDWGQAEDVGMPRPPVGQEIGSFDQAADAKAWIEELVAVAWKELEQAQHRV